MTVFEKLSILENFHFSGPITRLGLSQVQLRRVLMDPTDDTSVPLPKHGGAFQLSMQNTSTDRVVSGLRIRLGPKADSAPATVPDSADAPVAAHDGDTAMAPSEEDGAKAAEGDEVMPDAAGETEAGPVLRMGRYSRALDPQAVRWYGITVTTDEALTIGKELTVQLQGLPPGFAIYQVRCGA